MFPNCVGYVELVCMGANASKVTVGPMMLILQLLAWPLGELVPSINPDHVSRQKGRSWNTAPVCILLLSGLCILHFCSCQIVKVLYSLNSRLCLLLLWVICMDIQFKVTVGVISKICKEGRHSGGFRYLVITCKFCKE